jgi:hypothetical protein
MNDDGMSDFDWWDAFALIAMGVVLFFGGCGFGCDFGRGLERTKAGAAGVGQYVADPKTGQVEFKYGR